MLENPQRKAGWAMNRDGRRSVGCASWWTSTRRRTVDLKRGRWVVVSVLDWDKLGVAGVEVIERCTPHNEQCVSLR